MTIETFKAMVVPVCGLIGFLVLSYLVIAGIMNWQWYCGGVFALLGIWRVFREFAKQRGP